MEKLEIIKRIPLTKELVVMSKERIDEILEPYIKVRERLRAIEKIEMGEVDKYSDELDKYDLDFDYKIDYETALENVMSHCLAFNKDIKEIRWEFKNLTCDLRALRNGKEESEIEKIQHCIDRIRSEFPLLTHLCYAKDRKDLYSQFNGMIDILDEIESNL